MKLPRNNDKIKELFEGLYKNDFRKVRFTAELLESAYFKDSSILIPYKKEIFWLCKHTHLIQLKWHLAKILGKVPLDEDEFGNAWEILNHWARDRKESRIVRVNAVESISALKDYYPELQQEMTWLMEDLYQENIPSLNARIRIIKKRLKI
jgi:hypothetical protein